MAPDNPFIYARALTPAEGMHRPEARQLVERIGSGNNVVLHAPRRFGKTTLLKDALDRAERQDATPGVLVDLTDALGVADVAARLEQAFRTLPRAVRKLIGRELGSIAIATPVGGISVTRRTPISDPIAAIHALLELPPRIAAGHPAGRVVVVLDEIQALVALDGLDGVFRSHIQHQTNVTYLFAGSEPSLLRALFEDRARPLYGQAERIRLGRLDFHDTYDFIARKFSETGKDSGETTAELVGVAEGHPQRAMLIAHELWERVGYEEPAKMAALRAAFDAALRQAEAELRYLWASLSPNERRVVAAMAAGLPPFSKEARALTDLPVGGAVQRAIETLERRAVIERDEGDGDEWRIIDPLLVRWARRTGGARADVYVVPRKGGFVVTDGPSLAFERSFHPTLEQAEAEAQQVAAQGRGADIMVHDTDDPNDLPDWAVIAPERGADA